MKILIIEDEHRLSDSMKDYLEGQNYLCEQAFDFKTAKMMAGTYEYDCILLDLMLPGGSGLDILRTIRKEHKSTGVIIISAKDSLDDRVTGLKIGADDYLPKPFALPELSMRIYALIRRQEFSASNVVSSNHVEINLLTKSVTVNNHPVELTRSEYELLLFLISNRNKVISKAAIAEHLSGEMADMMDNYDFIYSHIKNLKAKLSRNGVKGMIQTIYGTGYRWKEV
ncbi:MAG: response regulator transcription factor [Prevotella sp.]|jgi:DNA-binding response OmpR family regulator|uniref:Response regulator transcription factor n=1 Tax=Segatella cerevisiae TaxID=2053716 RepID=A0ABT1BWT2_9BACT|nr:response regulator transcription factor [Segatella cerevisiae]MCH3969351.1 response regulator transcription factor [Prevotella sp.]MCH3991803.1 response regulator transcription factor [Prevotella sp.]MCH3993453.1 response regulator transcription factor [Prevotella sp.]MCH4017636.1 response regulator transcription factor [Prevotella sp.]MCH4185523.1 response regulator transcription factor [Prevotella sp.]